MMQKMEVERTEGKVNEISFCERLNNQHDRHDLHCNQQHVGELPYKVYTNHYCIIQQNNQQ